MVAQKYSVLIVEDHNHTAMRLSHSVKQHPELTVCNVASNLQCGLLFLQKHHPRIVLCDLGLPDGNGLDLIKAATRVDWTCDTLVISIFGDEQRVLAAIRAGACGYILKNSTNENIAQNILEVIAGGNPISAKIARYFLSLVNSVAPDEKPKTEGAVLTQREIEVLTAVSRGYKRAEIASDLSISLGTVGNHIHNIYKKLNVNSNIEAITEASKKGLM